MKRLLIILFSLMFFGCNSTPEEEKEQIRLHETYFDFATYKSILLRSQIEKYRVEYPKSTLSFYLQLITLDSNILYTYNTLDSCIKSENFQGYDNSISKYDSVMTEIEKVFKSFKEDYEEKPYRSNFNVINKTNKKLVLLKLKVDLAISYSNYLQIIYYFVDGSGGWSEFDLQTSSTIDSNGTATIKLSSEGIQLISQGRQLILDEISKNGKIISKNYNFLKINDFSNLIIDSLENGSYNIKGKVRYYTIKGIRDFPFEQELKVE